MKNELRQDTIDENELLSFKNSFPLYGRKNMNYLQRNGNRISIIPILDLADVIVKDTVIIIKKNSAHIPITIYRPKNIKHLLPTLIWIPDSLLWHDYENTDIFCSQLAKRANLQVIAVYYRVAPENKYPTAYEDVCGALKLITSSTENFSNKKKKRKDSIGRK